MKKTKTKAVKVPAVKSGYAYLDVKSGRRSLEKVASTNRVPVTIKGYIESDPTGWSDDGYSTQFTVSVENVTLGKPKKKAA